MMRTLRKALIACLATLCLLAALLGGVRCLCVLLPRTGISRLQPRYRKTNWNSFLWRTE